MDATRFLAWIDDYERAWRAPGTASLERLFADDATYLHSPYAPPHVGLPAIAQMWEAERAGPDEVFTMTREVVSVSGDTGVARVDVRYGEPRRQEYRDLWVVRFGPDGRATHFEEWPFWPGGGWSAGRVDPAVLQASDVDANPYAEVVRSGSLSAGIYRLGKGVADKQQPHGEDEVYVVLRGEAVLEIEGLRHPVRAGSLAYVPARADHRFVDIVDDLVTAVVFAPPEDVTGDEAR
jgi:mannose-6-phosphate isomerase-like protein (cupin superfamily)